MHLVFVYLAFQLTLILIFILTGLDEAMKICSQALKREQDLDDNDSNNSHENENASTADSEEGINEDDENAIHSNELSTCGSKRVRKGTSIAFVL